MHALLVCVCMHFIEPLHFLYNLSITHTHVQVRVQRWVGYITHMDVNKTAIHIAALGPGNQKGKGEIQASKEGVRVQGLGL